MSTWLLGAFNLLGNAAVSFAFAFALAALAARLLRLPDGRLRTVLLLLPFLKATYEVARGIPANAFFWVRLGGAEQDLGSFRLGLGVTKPLLPVIDLSLGASFQGRSYEQSIADVSAAGLGKAVAPWAPPLLGAILAAVALVATLRWLVASTLGAITRAGIVRAGRVVEVRPLGPRRVRIVVTSDARAAVVPFAGGLLTPWICFSAATYAALSTEEREAVIAHETAHLRHLDGPLLLLAGALGAAFTFVPWAARLVRAVGAQCELAADAAAARVVAREVLASALVRVAESAQGTRLECHGELAFTRPGKLLARRVAALLDDAPTAAPSRLRLVMSATTVALVAAAIMRATTFGNP